MSNGFSFFKHGGPGERLEINSHGDILKKYNGTETSWPDHSKIQLNGQSHKDQQRGFYQGQQNTYDFFKNNF